MSPRSPTATAAEGEIRFNRPTRTGQELEHLVRAIESDRLAGDGPYTRRCRDLLQEVLGVPEVLLTTSCTHALELSALLLDLQPGDEVIMPSFTFVSTANAFALRGAVPVFVDIRPDTLNLDEELLEAAVGERTRALVPIHYGGIGAAMGPILDIAGRHGVAVVEDNAHGLFGKVEGRWLGTFGELATLSFHETKNFSCGEGGALLINDPERFRRAEIIREKGTNRSQFLRGEVDKYTWVDLGSSFLPSELLAAYLYPQLLGWERIQDRRRRLWKAYLERLAAWAGEHGVGLPVVPEGVEPSYHLFHLILPSAEARDRFLAHMRQRGIRSVFHYVPLHTSPMGRRFGGSPGDLPVTEDLSARLARLPFYTGMSEEDRDRVVQAVLDFVP